MTPVREPDRLGPKMCDGLRAFAEVQSHRFDDCTDDQPAGFWFADAVLERMGYQPKVAASIIDRLGDRDYIEWGTTKRTGWLTERGERVYARFIGPLPPESANLTQRFTTPYDPVAEFLAVVWSVGDRWTPWP